MSSNALAICWTPTLIGNTSTSGTGTFFVQECIESAEWFFPDDAFPLLHNQQLDFSFVKRAQDLMNRQRYQTENSKNDYGFIGRQVQAPNHENEALSVLSHLKPRKKPAPMVPNGQGKGA